MTHSALLPEPDGDQHFALPPFVDTRLSNGLRVVTVHAPSVPMAELRLAIPLPAHTVDPAAASVLAAALGRRTARHTPEQMDDILGRRGTTLDVSWTGSQLTLSCSLPQQYLTDLLALLSEVLTAPAYGGAAGHGAIRKVVGHVRARAAQPAAMARDALQRHCWPSLSTSGPPDEAAVAAVTAEQLSTLHREVVRPDGAYLVVVGSADPAATAGAAASTLEAWRPSPRSFPPPPPMTSAGLHVIDRHNATQTHITLMAPAAARVDPVFPALSIGNCVLGGFFSSRLFTRLREDTGLVYQVESSIEDVLGRQVGFIESATAIESAPRALGEISQVLRRLCDEPPSAKEIHAASTYMTGITSIGQTSQAGMASTLAGVIGYNLPLTWLVEFPEQLRSVSPQQVSDAVRHHYRPAAFSGVLVGQHSALGDDVRALWDESWK
ncbi:MULTISPECIES: M16 family metallopeptidase [Streptomyces]|uniref:M16 family metallopeptidase n=1 Tax=Streptomyces TaxID=1883 RepID=UPI001E319CDF|nr:MULTISPECIES: insulinase family protein [Streptomyces]UFQ16862.1 insulinase family protein [Streptomyces huasconensis]WCL86465.1 insulinase family protein [Streptomyces sp. JCM 35825]